MGDCNTFREELAIKYPNYGHALWDPDPGGLYDSVQVGDVGFIRDGYFYRLFNALRSRDPPSDPDSHHDPDLVYPPKLEPEAENHIRRSTEPLTDFHSDNVTKEPGGPKFHTSGYVSSRASSSPPYTMHPSSLTPHYDPIRSDDDSTFTVSCSGKQGALLSLPLPAEREDTTARREFGQWLVKHIDVCVKLADDLGLGINRMEDIILVTGRHLARSWVSVLFSEFRSGAQVSFLAKPSGNSGVRLQERSMSGGDLKLGPSGEVSPPSPPFVPFFFPALRQSAESFPILRGMLEFTRESMHIPARVPHHPHHERLAGAR
jgi:hypothetical protein